MNKVQQQDGWIDYIEMGVTDVGRAKAFYAGVFGWEFTDYGPDYTSFFDGRLHGGLHTVPSAGSGTSLVVIYAADLDAMQARVREHGGSVVKETFEFPGGKRFHFADPDGNVLAVWSDR